MIKTSFQRARSAPAAFRRAIGIGVAATLFAMTGMVPASTVVPKDSRGTDYWLTFPGNYFGGDAISLFVSGDTATNGTVAIPGLGFSSPFSVTPGAVTTVSLPTDAGIQTTDTVESKGIHVTAGAEVSVYGLDRIQYTTDAYLGLPVDTLGQEYIVLGYQNSNVVNGTQFALVAAANATTVTITPSVTTGTHPVGVSYQVALNQGQTYQLRNTDSAPADLSGTIVVSDKPVAVFGSHQCANIPPGQVACDYVVEQMFPVSSWGKSFVTMPLATRQNGDTFRMVAGTNNTTVSINGAPVATLNRGQVHEQIVADPSHIVADKPILVAQYSNGSSYDNVTSDPFEVLIPPYEQFLASYTVTTPDSGFSQNFVNVVAPNSAVGNVTLDGTAIAAGNYTAIGTSGFSGATVAVSLGAHTLASTSPFGLTVYGFDSYDSYGYPGGLTLAEIARVTSLVLTPKTATNQVNTQHCVTATVKDQANDPISGVRVDFTVTGANPTTGFANSDASGNAQFCYTGANAGTDTITAKVGTLTDTASKEWVNQRSGGAFALEAKGTVAVPRTPNATCPPGGSLTKASLSLILGTVNALNASCATAANGTVAKSSVSSVNLFSGLLRIEGIEATCTSSGGSTTGTSKVGSINGKAIGTASGTINVLGVGVVAFNEKVTGPGGVLTQNAIRITKPATLGLLPQQIVLAGCYFS